MTVKKKKVDFSVRPQAVKDALPPDPDQWVRAGKGTDIPALQREEAGPHKRLTLNLPAALHTAFKSKCVVESVTIQDKVRLLIERELTAEKPTEGEGAPR